MRFPVMDVGVYESFVDGECGDWKLVEIGLYRIVGGCDLAYPCFSIGSGAAGRSV